MAVTSGRRVLHWVQRPEPRAVLPARRQAERLRVALAAQAAGRCAEPGLRPVALLRVQKAAPQAVWSFVGVRARVLARAPGVRRPAETAAWEASPNAVQGVGAARPDVAAAVAVAQLDAGVAEAAAQPGVVAEEAGLAAAVVQEAPGVPAAERPSGAAAWPSLPPFVAQPRLALPGRAMGCSSVAWPTGQSWQAAQFSSLSCALGPGEIQKRCRGGNAGETVNKHQCPFRSSGHFTEPRFELLNRYTSDQRTSVRPECGGFQTGTEIYFHGCAVSTRGRSRRIQGKESNRLGYRRRGRCRTRRAAGRGQFIGRVSRQFIWPLWLARLAHRRRNLRVGICRRIFWRRLGRLSRLDRRIF